MTFDDEKAVDILEAAKNAICSGDRSGALDLIAQAGVHLQDQLYHPQTTEE